MKSTMATPDLDTLRQGLAAATREKEQVSAEAARARARANELLGVLTPNDLQPTPDQRHVLEARVEYDDLDVARLDLAVAGADERVRAAREALDAVEAREVHARRRVIVSKLARALLAARPHADALRDLDLAHPIAGEFFGWSSLQSGTPTFEPLLTHWLVTVAGYDLLDAETLAIVRQSEAGDLLRKTG